ncbi:DUF5988 family protein [Saccharothrix algeriensis]|uniref:Uncharacterized protein n=1 Tax=Saccharothrix algeriensis TaxID=173560 RepID=A0A8T8HXF8_9PSEU|nr:DUF5988 family protein [Saccharothrix algeriensis]MBM7814821.1 hypothetical protein [Saccharothrix algeriensis]QTR03097.1 hypothetical protein J7S33_29695 [Saccharothrix algeriensis]
MPQRVLLAGGPSYVDPARRTCFVDDLDQPFKLPCYGGHEHFAFAGSYEVVDGHRVAVMRWLYRTALAE